MSAENEVLDVIDVIRSLLEVCGSDKANSFINVTYLFNEVNKPNFVADSETIFVEEMVTARSDESSSGRMELAHMKGLNDLECLPESRKRAEVAKDFACIV